MLGIPEEMAMGNVRETLMKQNPEINLSDRILEPKFCYTTKRGNRNLVIEVDSTTRIKLLQTRVQMGWTVCKLDDFIVAKNVSDATVIIIAIEIARGKKHAHCGQEITS